MEEATPSSATAARSIRLVRPPDKHGAAVFCVTLGDDSSFYVLREMDCPIGGRGFAVHKLGLGSLYHVRIGKPEECNCECKGFLYRGQCRHILGLLALIREGKL